MDPDEAFKFLTKELFPKVGIKEQQYKQIALMSPGPRCQWTRRPTRMAEFLASLVRLAIGTARKFDRFWSCASSAVALFLLQEGDPTWPRSFKVNVLVMFLNGSCVYLGHTFPGAHESPA